MLVSEARRASRRARESWTRSLCKSRRIHSAVRGLLLLGALAAGGLAGVAALPASAAAAPIALDAVGNGNPPQIAYDPTTGTTYVAWSNPQAPYGVDLCIVTVGASGCEGGAPIDLQGNPVVYTGDNTVGIGALVVLTGGGVAVIGTPVSGGVIAWTSPAGGASFLTAVGSATNQGLQNGGEPISTVNMFYNAQQAAALSSTDVAVLGGLSLSSFQDTALNAASGALTPMANGDSNPPPATPAGASQAWGGHPYYSNGPAIAAEPAPAPAPANTDIVVGVGDQGASGNDLTPTGCVNSASSGYGVAVGTVSGDSNAAGTLNGEALAGTALPSYGLLECSAEAPVLAQGGSGIGVVEEEGSEIDGAGSLIGVYYHPFTATATGGTFGPGVELADVTHLTLDGVDSLDLSEDSGSGVYAEWPDSNGLELDYSSTKGASWDGPAVVPAPTNGAGQGHPVLVGVGGGTAEFAYDGSAGTGDQVYLQAVNYQSLIAPAADTLSTTQTSGTSTGASITIPGGTVGETDKAVITGANAGSASGTVAYALYASSTCAASSLAFNGGVGTVAGGVVPASSAVNVALPPGKYYWLAAYSGNTGSGGNAASKSTCGSEVLTVGPATSIGGSGTSTTTTVTVTITCATAPCTVTITITVPSGSAAAASAAKAKKPVTIGSGKFTIRSAGSKKLTVKLSKAGKRLVKKDHGRLKALLSESQKLDGHNVVTTRTIKITKHHK